MEREPIELSEVNCKTLLQRSSLGFADYHINPYGGCAFGCSFCYVRSLRKFRGQEWKNWGEWVDAKMNAPTVLRRELARIDPEARIHIGSATDSWQPIERRLKITRAILEELSHHSHPIHVITRSPLLTRDIDLLKRIHQHGRMNVCISLSSFDEEARRVFEPRAPTVSARLRLIRTIVDSGLPTTLMWAPLLPGVSDNAEAVEEYLSGAAELGVKSVVCGMLNYRETMGSGYGTLLREYYAAKAACPTAVRTSLPRIELAQVIREAALRQGVSTMAGMGNPSTSGITSNNRIRTEETGAFQTERPLGGLFRLASDA